MIETETSWEDSGFDCDHCGGEIAKRTDRETGQPDRVCFQCKQCGCQWTPGGDVLRFGSGPNCKAAHRGRIEFDPVEMLRSPRVLIVLGILILLLVIRLGGFAFMFSVLRLLILLAIAAIVIFFVVRFGREQEWW